MKVVVSGSRNITSYDLVAAAIEESGFRPTLIIEGGQRTVQDGEIVGGADWFARQWAERNGIECKTVDAEWGTYGTAAGPIRNRKQARMGDALVALPSRKSRGTRDMIKAMKEVGKEKFIHTKPVLF